MAFHNVRFPEDIAYGSGGGPMHSVYDEESDSGHDTIIERWDNPLREYEVDYHDRSPAQIAALLTFFVARRGPLCAFRFKDWGDYSTAPDHVSPPLDSNVQIGVGNGSGNSYQLIKKYASGGVTHTRDIRLPVQGTVSVSVNGIVLPSSEYDVCHETGMVYLVNAPSSGHIVRAGCEFDTMVRFADEDLALSIDDPTTRSASTIKLREVRDELIDQGRWTGGSAYRDPGTNYYFLNQRSSFLQNINGTAAGNRVYLPQKATLERGGPRFLLINTGNTTQRIYDVDTQSELATLPASGAMTFWLVSDSLGNSVWLWKAGTVA